MEKARLKKLLADAEAGMTTARTLASKQYQSLLINSPEQPFAVPNNKDPKVKNSRTSGGAVRQGVEGSATNPKTVTSQAEAEELPSGTHFIMNGRKGRIE